jgi:hypothetical protein
MCLPCVVRRKKRRDIFSYIAGLWAVWYALNRWLGVVVVPPGEVLMSYGMLVGSGRNKKGPGRDFRVFG